jgi:dTDP-4-dehydrorhamnose 3,5-epimerase-like enzyme
VLANVKIIAPDFIFGDDRGKLVQLVHDGFKQVNLITSKAGFKRGGHYHKLNTEAFYVISGSFELVTHYEGKEEKQMFKEGDMFYILPLVAHDFIYREDTILVSMYDKGVELDENEKDIHKG